MIPPAAGILGPPMAHPKTPTNPHGAGRAPRDKEAARPQTIRMTPTERKQFNQAAKAEGLTFAEWVRAACVARLPKRKAKR